MNLSSAVLQLLCRNDTDFGSAEAAAIPLQGKE